MKFLNFFLSLFSISSSTVCAKANSTLTAPLRWALLHTHFQLLPLGVTPRPRYQSVHYSLIPQSKSSFHFSFLEPYRLSVLRTEPSTGTWPLPGPYCSKNENSSVHAKEELTSTHMGLLNTGHRSRCNYGKPYLLARATLCDSLQKYRKLKKQRRY